MTVQENPQAQYPAQIIGQFPDIQDHPQKKPQNYCCAYAKAYWKILTGQGLQDAGQIGRSEERRVGKECRSRWSPYH